MSDLKIVYGDFCVNDRRITNVPYEILDGYGEVLDMKTAHYIELLLLSMIECNIYVAEYTEGE